MSLINKVGFYIVIFFLVFYYGILPLMGLEVWIRNKGWIHMEMKQSLFNIIVGLFIYIFIKRYNKNLK